MLLANHSGEILECGVDEVGRGCISGPVVAAAVILPDNYENGEIRDSKKLSEKKREKLYNDIRRDAFSYAIGEVSPEQIDDINILNASILAMHHAIHALPLTPKFILVDGNQFKRYHNIPHECVIKGDDKFLSIAAASILAKVYRDNLMKELAVEFPIYDWHKNKGYPTKFHLNAVKEHGLSVWHRKSFRIQ